MQPLRIYSFLDFTSIGAAAEAHRGLLDGQTDEVEPQSRCLLIKLQHHQLQPWTPVIGSGMNSKCSIVFTLCGSSHSLNQLCLHIRITYEYVCIFMWPDCVTLSCSSLSHRVTEIRLKFMNSLCWIAGGALKEETFLFYLERHTDTPLHSYGLSLCYEFHPWTCDPQFVGYCYENSEW